MISGWWLTVHSAGAHRILTTFSYRLVKTFNTFLSPNTTGA